VSVAVPSGLTDLTGLAKSPVKPTTNSTTIATTAITATGTPQTGLLRCAWPSPAAKTIACSGAVGGFSIAGTVATSAMRQPIVFVTDFGRDDAYAAALVGAAFRVDPHAICVEGTHGIPPGDVLAGAYQLKALARAFTGGAVFCAVIDPGVGTERRAIAVKVGGIRCVAPDNGLVSYLWDETPPEDRWAVRIDIPPDASPTFHGRDVFAPFAAELSSKERFDVGGDLIDDPVVLAEAFASRAGTHITGRVAVVDHFGNAITTIRAADIGGAAVRSVTWPGGRSAGLVATYAHIAAGPGALIGSAGHLEVAGRGLRAEAVSGPRVGDTVEVELA
jgi:S-adenosyl-L-methionine hydrolase (adenosine-forming)